MELLLLTQWAAPWVLQTSATQLQEPNSYPKGHTVRAVPIGTKVPEADP